MPPFTSHIFVCCNTREPGHPRGCCNPDRSESLRHCFKAELAARGLGPLVRVNAAGCLEQCECGPTVVIYPQGIWYGNVTPADVPRILDETVIGGRVLEDIQIDAVALNTRGQVAWRRRS
jgi:(2Fe-2S) ferredoxin